MSLSILLLAALSLGWPVLGWTATPTGHPWLYHPVEDGDAARAVLRVPTGHGSLTIRWVSVPQDTHGQPSYDDGHFSIFRRNRLVADGTRAGVEFFEYVQIEGVFDFPTYSVVVVSGSGGGNTNPDTYLPVIVYPDHAVPVHDHAFRTVTWTFAASQRQDGVVLDFGYRNRRRQAFLLRRDRISRLPKYRAADATRVPKDLCQSLGSVLAETYTYRHIDGAGSNSDKGEICEAICRSTVDHPADVLGHAAADVMTVAHHHPAFQPKAFIGRCRQACLGQLDEALAGFARAVCRRP